MPRQRTSWLAWHPLILESPLINSGPKQWDIWKLAASTEETGTWTGHFTGTSQAHSNYFFRYNQSYFIQACVPLPFVIAKGNLQFNKTLRSVICINCQFCFTPVHFNHSTYNWEQIKFRLHDNASLNVQLLQKEIFETFSKCLSSPIYLETSVEQLTDQLSRSDPQRWFQSITHNIRSGTVTLVIVLVIIFVIYCCLSIRLVNINQTHLVRTFFTNIIK